MTEDQLRTTERFTGTSTTDLGDPRRTLLIGLAAYVVGSGTHAIAHISMGLMYTPEPVIWVAVVNFAALMGLTVAIFRRGRYAALLLALAGLLSMAALFAIHAPPHWGPFSMPLRAGTGMFMWLSLTLAVAGSFVALLAGLRVMRASAP